jgi:hypothetical protein
LFSRIPGGLHWRRVPDDGDVIVDTGEHTAEDEKGLAAALANAGAAAGKHKFTRKIERKAVGANGDPDITQFFMLFELLADNPFEVAKIQSRILNPLGDIGGFNRPRSYVRFGNTKLAVESARRAFPLIRVDFGHGEQQDEECHHHGGEIGEGNQPTRIGSPLPDIGLA